MGIIWAVLFSLGVGWTLPLAASGPSEPGSSLVNSMEDKLQRISTYLEYVHNETYVGGTRSRSGRPHYTQRTSFLYFYRKPVGDPLVWMTLALGKVGNRGMFFNDKKKSVQVWKEENPRLFSMLEEYMPRMWTDAASFARDVEDDKLYVFKRSDADMGAGIRFERGSELSKYVADLENMPGYASTRWVIQAFVDPFLHDGRKTHIRVLTLIIVQPSGEHEFYQFRKLKMFFAAERFDEERLVREQGAAVSMLVTNLHESQAWFKEHVSEGTYSRWNYLMGTKDAIKEDDSGIKYARVYNDVTQIHTLLYSIIGHRFTCEGTEISIRDDVCFHIIASDIAIDKGGKPYFLEGNTGMNLRCWTASEIGEFSNGAAALIEVPETPFKVEKTPLWQKLNLLPS